MHFSEQSELNGPHPVRRAILVELERYGGRSLSRAELSRELGEPVSQVSYHVGVLADAELIEKDPAHSATERFRLQQ